MTPLKFSAFFLKIVKILNCFSYWLWCLSGFACRVLGRKSYLLFYLMQGNNNNNDMMILESLDALLFLMTVEHIKLWDSELCLFPNCLWNLFFADVIIHPSLTEIQSLFKFVLCSSKESKLVHSFQCFSDFISKKERTVLKFCLVGIVGIDTFMEKQIGNPICSWSCGVFFSFSFILAIGIQT